MEQIAQEAVFEAETGMQEQQSAPVEKKKRAKTKEGVPKTLIRVIISLAIIVVGVAVVLLLVAKAGRFDSVGSMLQHMFVELSLMWQRIRA